MTHTLAPPRRRPPAELAPGWSFKAVLVMLVALTMSLAPSAAAFASDPVIIPSPDVSVASTDDDAAGEIPAEEIPAEEIPAEEIPAEEIPAEEIPAEETPVKTTSAEDDSAEGAAGANSAATITLAGCVVSSSKDISNIAFFAGDTSLGKDESINSETFDLTTFDGFDDVTRIVVKSGTTSKPFDGIDCGSGDDGSGDDGSGDDGSGDDGSGDDGSGDDGSGDDGSGDDGSGDDGSGDDGSGDDGSGDDGGNIVGDDAAKGNNGTIKLRDESGASGKRNDPHLPCPIYLGFFGFDAQNTAEVEIVGQSPTPGVVGFGGRTSFTFEGQADNTREHEEPYTLDLSDLNPPHQNQGYHIKFSVSVNGGNPKHKTVWVRACDAPEAPDLSVTVDKVNDANENGVFNDSERANTAGQSVDFTATITNTSDVDVEITSITDTVGTETIDVCDGETGENLIGEILGAGDKVTCEFTLAGYGPAADGENKINTVEVVVIEPGNADNTASADDTSTVRPPSPVGPVLSVTVDKTNNANGDDAFNDAEQAEQGAAVPFQVVIENTSAVPVLIGSITDSFSGETLDVCDGVNGQDLVGTTLDVGEVVTCTFTLPDYAPTVASAALVNTVTVVVTEPGNPSNTGRDADTSVVTTPPPLEGPVLSVTVDKTNNANGDDAFNDAEQAEQGADVPFQVVIENTSAVPVLIGSITDSFSGETLDVCDGVNGQDLVGTTLDVGEVVTCTFTLPDYAPTVASAALVNTVTVVVTEPGNPGNTGRDADTSVVTTPLTPPDDLRITKVDDVADGVTIEPGDTFGYTITVTNDGTTPVAGFVVDDTLPTELTLAGEASGTGFVCEGTVTLLCTYDGILAAGDSVTLSVPVTLSLAFEGVTVVNTANVPLTGDPTPANNTDTETTPVTVVEEEEPTDRVDLRIEKTDAVSSVAPGDELTYTLRVTNDGAADVSGFVVSDNLPVGLSLVSTPTGAGFECTDTEMIVCTYNGILEPRASVTITVVTLVADDVTSGTLVNTATVPLEGDPTPGNNTDTETTPVIVVLPEPPADRPDVSIVKDDAGASVRPGGQLTYTLTVKNEGLAAVSGVRVTDTLPRGLSLNSVDADDFRCSTKSRALDCTLIGSLAAGDSVVLTVVTTLASNFTGSAISNTGVVDPLPGETNTGNNTSTEATPVVLPQTFDRPAPPAQVDPAQPDNLPFTGSATDTLLTAAVSMLLLGIAAQLVGRRRQLAMAGSSD